MRKISIFVVMSMCFALGSRAWAEDVASYLIGEQASLMDIGIMRLDRALGDRGVVYYEEAEGKLVIFTLRDGVECPQWAEEVRSFAGVDLKTGRVHHDRPSNFTTFFRHHGYETNREPRNFGADLNSMFVLWCATPQGRYYGDLLGTGLEFEDIYGTAEPN